MLDVLREALIPGQITGGQVAVFLAVGSVSAMLFSMAKSGFGGGVGILAVPLMVYACNDSTLATGIMLPMLIVADYVAVITWWQRWSIRRLLPLMPGVVIGIAGAWVALYALKRYQLETHQAVLDSALKIAIGTIALVFVGLFLWRAIGRKPLAFRPVTWQAVGAGSVAGFTSTLAHAAGPVAAMYLLPQGMRRQHYVATTAAFFWTVNQLKLPAYYHLGMINTETLGAGVALLPAIAAGAVLGRLLHGRVNDRQFLGVVYALLTLAGAGLIYKGIAELVG